MNEERLRALYERATASRGTSRETCPSPEALLALARREGAEAERLRTLDHAMSCPGCRQELDLLRAIHAAAPALDRSERSRGASRVRRFAVPMALAATAVIAVTLTLRPRGAGPDVETTRGSEAALAVYGPTSRELRPGMPLTLAWRPAASGARYVVEVLDDAGHAVLTRTTSDTSLTLDPGAALVPGRDYR